MTEKVSISLGAMSAPIGAQLRIDTTHAPSVTECAKWDRYSRYVTELVITGLLTDGEVQKIRKRIVKGVAGAYRSLKFVEATP